MEEPKVKRAKLGRKIGTHNGHFHCDEALACFMLKQLPEYNDAEIVRTRTESVLNECDVVVDVGGVFDPSKNRFDHHQKTFTDTMNSLNPDYKWTIKLSSAGLIYYHFGKSIISGILDNDPDDRCLSIIYRLIYENFVQEIDAIDNGVDVADAVRYSVSTGVSSRVSHLNPFWNKPATDEEVDKMFRKAMNLVGEEFVERVRFYGEVWWPARKLVQDGIDKRFDVHSSGEIMKLHPQMCPWKEHLFMLEEEQEITPSLKYVLFQDTNGSWRVQCIPKERGSFQNRLSLPEAWCGLRNEKLSEVSKIEGCVFVHANGFIGGNSNYEGALKMATESLQLQASVTAPS